MSPKIFFIFLTRIYVCGIILTNILSVSGSITTFRMFMKRLLKKYTKEENLCA